MYPDILCLSTSRKAYEIKEICQHYFTHFPQRENKNEGIEAE